MTLTIGKRFQFPVAKRSKIADATLRRIIGYGCHFIVLDIEICIKDGTISHSDDMIFIMEDLGDEKMWKFKRNEIEDILDEGKP